MGSSNELIVDFILQPQFETIAKNRKITLKNSVYRFVITLYSYWLKWNGKNLKTKRSFPKDKLIERPIEKGEVNHIMLHTRVPVTKAIDTLKDAGNYVCNYAMWIVERSIAKNIEFYFIHLPPKLNNIQERDLSKFILK